MYKLQSIATLNPHRIPLSYWYVFASVGGGALIGGVLLIFGPTIALGIPLSLIFIYMLFKIPEYVVLILLLFTSGILPAKFNPYLSLGIGHFQLSDLILIALLAVTFVRSVAERDFILRITPLGLPLLLFCISIFIGIGTAVTNHGIRFSYTTYEARILLYYSLFFAVVNLVKTHQQIRRVIFGVFSIGTLVAILILTYIMFGMTIPLFPPGYFKQDLLTRAYHPGFSATYMSSMALVCLLAFRTARRCGIAIWITLIILGLSLLASLGRNMVISTALSMILLLFLLRSPQREQWIINISFFIILAIGIFGLASILAPSSPVLAYPQVLIDRFAHLFSTDVMSDEETLLWRIKEIRFAWEKIAQNPFLGIGLKTPYRAEFFEGDDLLSYIHNGYLWIWLKMGLLGLVSFIWFLFSFLTRGLRKWRDIQNEFLRSTTLSFILAVFALTFSNFVAPSFVEGFNLAFLAAGMGIAESIFALSREPE